MSVNWMAYRDPKADQDMENDKLTTGALPEQMPPPQYHMGAGNMHENMFADLPTSQRMASKMMGMKGMEYDQNGDVTGYGEGESMKRGDEQANRMMREPPPVGTEDYEGQYINNEKDY